MDGQTVRLTDSFLRVMISGELRGSVGLLTYDIADTDHKVAVMFSVPFDWNLYDVWFNMKV